MRHFLTALLIASFFCFTPVEARDKQLVERVKSSVAILYSQDSSGGLNMHCTVTAFEQITKDITIAGKPTKLVTGYYFATAAHCIGDDNVPKELAADTKTTPFFITYDHSKVKTFYAAIPVFVGYQSRGEDLAMFRVNTNEEWPITPLGDEKKASDGDEILNVSAPLGLGKQVLYGNIASVFLDRPLIQDTINWTGTITLSLPGINGGSSGSAIVSEDQKAIVGILVGTVGEQTIVAIPISRFKAVRKAVEEGKYKWYQPVVQTNPDGSPVAE